MSKKKPVGDEVDSNCHSLSFQVWHHTTYTNAQVNRLVAYGICLVDERFRTNLNGVTNSGPWVKVVKKFSLEDKLELIQGTFAFVEPDTYDAYLKGGIYSIEHGGRYRDYLKSLPFMAEWIRVIREALDAVAEKPAVVRDYVVFCPQYATYAKPAVFHAKDEDIRRDPVWREGLQDAIRFSAAEAKRLARQYTTKLNTPFVYFKAGEKV